MEAMLQRTPDGVWTLQISEDESTKYERNNSAYLNSVPRYMTALDSAFTRAKEVCECEFLFSLLRVRSLMDVGWDPYETTLRAIPSLVDAHNQMENSEAARHLQLWIYGHILEASEPYELLSNLIGVALGERFFVERFPNHSRGRPQSPGEKIVKIEQQAREAGLPEASLPLREIWNRDLRNSIFHADYALFRGEVRTIRPIESYSDREIKTITNRAHAYHEALAVLYKVHLESYTEPIQLELHSEFGGDPDLKMTVIVREDFGAAGLKDSWTQEQLVQGRIPLRIGRFTPEEITLLDADPTLATLPADPQQQEYGR